MPRGPRAEGSLGTQAGPRCAAPRVRSARPPAHGARSVRSASASLDGRAAEASGTAVAASPSGLRDPRQPGQAGLSLVPQPGPRASGPAGRQVVYTTYGPGLAHWYGQRSPLHLPRYTTRVKLYTQLTSAHQCTPARTRPISTRVLPLQVAHHCTPVHTSTGVPYRCSSLHLGCRPYTSIVDVHGCNRRGT